MSSQLDKGNSDIWIFCNYCNTKLCKKVGKGRYEMKHRRNSKKTIESILVVGSIRCHNCGNWKAIPTASVQDTPKPGGVKCQNTKEPKK